jgi:hypothetical protein
VLVRVAVYFPFFVQCDAESHLSTVEAVVHESMAHRSVWNSDLA